MILRCRWGPDKALIDFKGGKESNGAICGSPAHQMDRKRLLMQGLGGGGWGRGDGEAAIQGGSREARKKEERFTL